VTEISTPSFAIRFSQRPSPTLESKSYSRHRLAEKIYLRRTLDGRTWWNLLLKLSNRIV
jgi:hypothetical protein